MNSADLRVEYKRSELDESHADADPVAQFSIWWDEATKAQVRESNAMTLATADAAGKPAARTVLLKGFDQSGFVFFTNYESRKGSELAANAHAALLFFWPELERQVRISGPVSVVSRDESEAYFQTRPRPSQLSTWVSSQSRVIAGRKLLEDGVKKVEGQFPGQVPLPPHWGGFRVTPETVEFWQGRESRLHDRLRYARKKGGGWQVERLSP